MKRISLSVTLALGLLAAAAVPAQPRPFTVDDEMKLRSIVDVRISPDGERIAYAVSTPSLAKNEHEVALYVVPSRGGAPSRLGESVKISNSPLLAPRLRWSPDGSAIGLLAFAGEKPQVHAIPASGAAPRQLTDAPEGVFGFDWSPDGKTLAYLSRDPVSPDEARQRQDKSFVIHVDAPERPARIFVRPVEGGPARPLTPVSHYVDSLTWSPDGRSLAYSAASRSGFSSQYDTRIYAVPSSGGTPRAVVDRTGMNTRPQWSPDGARIAFISTNGRVDIMASRSLTVAPASGGPPRVYPMDDAWVNEFLWARDGKSIFFQANDGTFASREHMFEQPIARLWIESGRAERVVSGASVDYSISLSADGRRLAFRAVEGRTMGDVFVRDTSTGRATKITDVNPELRDRALGKLESVKWRSFDGMEIWGLLLTPPSRTPGRRLPLIVYCHGGPGGGVTYGLFPQFMHTVGQVDPYPTEALASAGFAVLFPMPRGGAGYGEAGQRAIVDAWGEADYRDIMTGVDAMIERGVADPGRLGVLGASYGGYMTNWIVTQTGRFKAASASASICDLTDPFFLSDGGEFMTHYFKRPWENRGSYVSHSPLTFADRVTTPLLIQHGERDPRVPIAGAWKFYRTLKALGKMVEFDISPGGGHVLYQPALQRESMRRNLEWFQRWIRVEPLAVSAAVSGVTLVANGRDAPGARQAIDRWLAGIPGSSAGEATAIDESSIERALPSLRFYVFRFRQYPVAPAIPESLAPTNLLVVKADGTVERILDAGALEATFRSAAAPVRTRKQAEEATRAWLRLTQEFHQDGFFHFAAPRIVSFTSGAGGIRVSGRVLVLPDAADSGEIRVTLAFDKGGRLVKASEDANVVAGHRPI